MSPSLLSLSLSATAICATIISFTRYGGITTTSISFIPVPTPSFLQHTIPWLVPPCKTHATYAWLSDATLQIGSEQSPQPNVYLPSHGRVSCEFNQLRLTRVANEIENAHPSLAGQSVNVIIVISALPTNYWPRRGGHRASNHVHPKTMEVVTKAGEEIRAFQNCDQYSKQIPTTHVLEQMRSVLYAIHFFEKPQIL